MCDTRSPDSGTCFTSIGLVTADYRWSGANPFNRRRFIGLPTVAGKLRPMSNGISPLWF